MYETVLIGDQVWMTKNLKVMHYRNGDVIQNIINNEEWGSLYTGAYGDYENNPSNSETYGRLYNWYTVDDERGVCPVGWHATLTFRIVKNLEQNSQFGTSGFNGLPSGYRLFNNDNYNSVGYYGFFWSSSEDTNNNAWSRGLYYYLTSIYGAPIVSNTVFLFVA